MRNKLPTLLIENHGANDVSWQEIRSKLDALKARLNGTSQSLDGKCLCQPWNALQQEMSLAENSDEQPVDHVLLPDNHLLHFPLQTLHKRAFKLHLLMNGLDVNVHSHSTTSS